MKFAYIDESGGEDQGDIFVMGGVLIDASRLRKRTSEFDEALDKMRKLHPSKTSEFKTKRFMRGKGGWRKIPLDTRNEFIQDVITLIKDTKVSVYAYALSLQSIRKINLQNFGSPPKDQKNYWFASAILLSSLIQKNHQQLKNNKGHTVLIFDDNQKDMPKISNALYVCNSWYDDLYAKARTNWKITPASRFNQIINTAFAINSEHSSLIQVADIICYVYRRHLELKSSNEAYAGEKKLYDNWASQLEEQREKMGNTPKNSPAVKFYDQITHEGWKW